MAATRNMDSSFRDAPPPYTPPSAPWAQAPPPAYAPPTGGYAGWVPPTATFPDRPPGEAQHRACFWFSLVTLQGLAFIGDVGR